MRKFFSVVLIVVMVIALAGCLGNKDTSTLLNKEGIAPFKLTERESYLLQSFGMENNSQIITFNAPKEAITIEANVYRLNDRDDWESIGGGAMSLGNERIPVDKLTGTFTTLLNENYTIDFHINCSGRGSYTTNDIDVASEYMVSSKTFLREFQDIEINKEIPVAIMVYDSGPRMQSYSLQDYFEPSRFDQMDLVQVVTLTFTDKDF
ncbi:hypothetical protein [Cellulosilyticum sp. I15G10I2]|uniref:hypothetical protein n=1 Tax=Cellulosilyticum sp. I15G10I2 TaxID=1892843 RepID=UPI00085BDCD7|nr:hypothetical protein [Cellulosilyticum sp. I15G10I2]